MPSKEIGAQLGLSDAILDDVETWLHGARLIQFVAYGPIVCLTHAGRRWAEGGASLAAPPADSNTVIVNVGAGGTVGAIQTAGSNSTQWAVVLDQKASVRDWINDVRAWAKDTGAESPERERLLVRLDDLLEELDEPAPDPNRLRRAWDKSKNALSAVVGSAAGNAGGAGLVEAAKHLDMFF